MELVINNPILAVNDEALCTFLQCLVCNHAATVASVELVYSLLVFKLLIVSRIYLNKFSIYPPPLNCNLRPFIVI